MFIRHRLDPTRLARIPLVIPCSGETGADRADKAIFAPCTLAEFLVWLVNMSRERAQRQSSKSTALSVWQLPADASSGRS